MSSDAPSYFSPILDSNEVMTRGKGKDVVPQPSFYCPLTSFLFFFFGMALVWFLSLLGLCTSLVQSQFTTCPMDVEGFWSWTKPTATESFGVLTLINPFL